MSAKESKKVKVALAGASGLLGVNVANAFLGHESYHTTILRRKAPEYDDKAKAKGESYADFIKRGAAVVDVDYSNADSLAASLVGFDVVVCTFGMAATIEPQLTLLQAAITAKVKRFVPADYGVNTAFYRKAMGEKYNDSFIVAGRVPVETALHKAAAAGQIEYTIFNNAAFQEYGIPIVDFKEQKIHVPGSLATKVTMTSVRDIGALIPPSLLLPESKNAELNITGELLSFQDISDIVFSITGKRFTHDIVSVAQLESEYFGATNKFAVMKQLGDLSMALGGLAMPVKGNFRETHFPKYQLHTFAQTLRHIYGAAAAAAGAKA